MLAIRMQRTGRKGHAMFRVVVQESRLTPTSGKVVALLGSYDPHAKAATLDKEKAAFYLGNGAQPSERAARLLKSEGVKLPAWVKLSEGKTGAVRHPDKLRRNKPAEEAETEAKAPEEAAEATTSDDTTPDA
jgi:small subunit ribosomal protein S16